MGEVQPDRKYIKELSDAAIPKARQALLSSHKNLDDLAVYCEQFYQNANSQNEKVSHDCLSVAQNLANVC